MEVLHGRNKHKANCEEDWKNHDQHVMEEIMSKTGCRPPHWKSEKYPLCRSQADMKKVLPPLTKHGYLNFTPPCRSITNFPYSFQEIDEDENRVPEHFGISITSADTTFKNVEQIREYSFQSLVGNVGGYLGLILGYSAIHLPFAVFKLYKLSLFHYKKPTTIKFWQND